MRTTPLRLAIVIVVLGAFLSVAVSPASAQVGFGQNRDPLLEEPAALTDADAPDVGVDFPAGAALYSLGPSGSGSHSSGDACPGTGGSFTIVWVSEPLFVPTTNFTVSEAFAFVVENLTVPLGIEPGPQFAAAGGGVATGIVEFKIGVGWIRAAGTVHDPHASWGDTVEARPAPADLPELPVEVPVDLGILPDEIVLDIGFPGDLVGIDARSRLTVYLEVTCEGLGDFTLTFGDVGPIRYVWGEPRLDDTDGDGVPDQYDPYPDGSTWSAADQRRYGTNPLDPSDTPDNESICPGYTIQQAVDEGFERDREETCPGGGGIPWLLLLVLLAIIILLLGGGFVAMTAVNRKILLEVSHDGFQDIPQGGAAVYALALTAKGDEGDEIPVELSLKGVPEDWSATLEPMNVLLVAGEDQEPVAATLTVTPPGEEEYEAEAVITVIATPTDEDGKSSPVKPGTAVKTKTIVNIDKEAPAGHKRKKADAPPGESATGDTEEESGRKKGFGLAFLKRRGKEEAEEAPADAEAGAAAATPGKPDLAVGKLKHEPADFSEGDTVTTTVPVRNKGDAAVEALMLRLYVNDERVDEKEVSLEPGATAEITFTWTAQPDENRVRVRGGLKEA